MLSSFHTSAPDVARWTIKIMFANNANIFPSAFAGGAEYPLFGDLSALHDFSSLLSLPDSCVLTERVGVAHGHHACSEAYHLEAPASAFF